MAGPPSFMGGTEKYLFHAKSGNLLFARLPPPKLLKADTGLDADGVRVFISQKNTRFKGKNSKEREQKY